MRIQAQIKFTVVPDEGEPVQTILAADSWEGTMEINEGGVAEEDYPAAFAMCAEGFLEDLVPVEIGDRLAADFDRRRAEPSGPDGDPKVGGQ